MEEKKTATQTPSGDLWELTAKVANSRSLLDLAREYILSGQEDRTDGEKLENVLFAIEKARDEARAAELGLYGFNPYRQQTARGRALEAENTALKAHLLELERDKSEAWRQAREEAKAYQLQLMTEAGETPERGRGMTIDLDRTRRAVAQFERLGKIDRGRAVAVAAGLVTQREDRQTFTRLYSFLDGEEKLILEAKIASFLQEAKTV